MNMRQPRGRSGYDRLMIEVDRRVRELPGRLTPKRIGIGIVLLFAFMVVVGLIAPKSSSKPAAATLVSPAAASATLAASSPAETATVAVVKRRSQLWR